MHGGVRDQPQGASPRFVGEPDASASFELIPDTISANDMSPDGRYFVGNTFNSGPYLMDWETRTMTILPAPGVDAVAVSDDGATVLGTITDPDTGTYVAAIWTAADGWVSLGYLPNASPCGLSSAYELSADGTVATGLSWDGCEAFGFIWTQSTGMLALEGLANGVNRASVISGDGSLIGGFAQGSFSRTPAFWLDTTEGTLLTMQRLEAGDLTLQEAIVLLRSFVKAV